MGLSSATAVISLVSHLLAQSADLLLPAILEVNNFMKKWLYKAWSKFLTAFGDIKIFRFPFFIVYDPDDYQVTGQDTLDIMAALKPGDVILRGYTHYADGKFIPDKLKFSHGAIYIGNNKIIHAVAEGVSETDVIEFTRCDRIAIFRPRKF